MNIKLNALCLGGFLALASVLAQPVMADEWNKRTEFQFSGPVEIPGRVLAPGKYVFELADNGADRDLVQVFSEDSSGKDTLVTTLIAIPKYIEDAPDKPTVHFEERQPGSPEAIESWYYPGENTGWKFVYHKLQTSEASTITTPAPAPVAAAAAPSQPPAPPAPQVQAEPATSAAMVEEEEEFLIPQNDAPAPPPAPEADTQGAADRTLPQTGGYSDLQLMAGVVMFACGIAAVFAFRRKSLA